MAPTPVQNLRKIQRGKKIHGAKNLNKWAVQQQTYLGEEFDGARSF